MNYLGPCNLKSNPNYCSHLQSFIFVGGKGIERHADKSMLGPASLQVQDLLQHLMTRLPGFQNLISKWVNKTLVNHGSGPSQISKVLSLVPDG